MGEALAEAQLALARGERPNAAVAVVDEAMVVRAHDRVQETNDPTAHAVVVALRETARKLGSVRLADATIFTTQEPCAMCVGALLESDVEALVFAWPMPLTPAGRSSSWPSTRGPVASRSSAGSVGTGAALFDRPDRRRVIRRFILSGGEVSGWCRSESGKAPRVQSRPLRHVPRLRSPASAPLPLSWVARCDLAPPGTGAGKVVVPTAPRHAPSRKAPGGLARLLEIGRGSPSRGRSTLPPRPSRGPNGRD